MSQKSGEAYTCEARKMAIYRAGAEIVSPFTAARKDD